MPTITKYDVKFGAKLNGKLATLKQLNLLPLSK